MKLLSLLTFCFLVCGLPATATGAGGSQISLGQVRFAGVTQPDRLRALESVAAEISQRTSIEASRRAHSVPIQSDERFRYPLMFLPCSAPVPVLGLDEETALSIWMRMGGTLVIDWQGGAADLESFRTSLERFVATVLPGRLLERVPRTHVLYRSFYRLKYASGRIQLVDDLYGVVVEDRYALLVSFNDLLSAAERSADGSFSLPVVPGGENQREDAIRFLVNIVAYILCLDYKDDKVHLDYLRSRRNWQLPVED
jgi:hypothetical protein